MPAEVKVDSTWLRSKGHVSSVKWSTRWGAGPCGPELASCTLAVSPNADSSLLRVGRTLETWADGVLMFGGESSEPTRGFPWTLSAKGLASRAADFDAVDGSGNPTMNPRTAVTQAIARGLPWTNPNAFPNVSIGDASPVPLRLDQLLDQWAITDGKRWGTDAYGVAFAEADPTEPTLFLDARDLNIGVAEDGLFTAVRATYVSSVDGVTGEPDGWDYEVATDAAAVALYGVREYAMPLTDLGYMVGATALAYATAQLALLTVPQWLNRITTNSRRLRTKGGLGAHLPSVKAGQMVRLYNVPRTLGGIQSELGLNVVLGEVEYDTDNPEEITLAPVNLAVRNLADMATQAKRAADAARRAA